MLTAKSSVAIVLAGLILHCTDGTAVTRVPAPSVREKSPVREPPELQPPPDLPGTAIFSALYQCKDVGGSGCSAGCGSASFSPLVYLTVSLRSISVGDGSKTIMYYYYLVQQAVTSGKKSGDPKKGSGPTAQGFTLDTSALCGAVNMDMKYCTLKVESVDNPHPAGNTTQEGRISNNKCEISTTKGKALD